MVTALLVVAAYLAAGVLWAAIDPTPPDVPVWARVLIWPVSALSEFMFRLDRRGRGARRE